MKAAAVSAEREILKELRTRTKEAVKLDDRPCPAPPIVAEGLLCASGELAGVRSLCALGGEVLLVACWANHPSGRPARRQ